MAVLDSFFAAIDCCSTSQPRSVAAKIVLPTSLPTAPDIAFVQALNVVGRPSRGEPFSVAVGSSGVSAWDAAPWPPPAGENVLDKEVGGSFTLQRPLDSCEPLAANLVRLLQPSARRPLGIGSDAIGSGLGQVVVVVNWDDVLFPTSYLHRELQLDATCPLDEQHQLSELRRREISLRLGDCEAQAAMFLRACHFRGRVVVVSLAGRSGVQQVCRLFYPVVGALLQELDIDVNAVGSEDQDLSAEFGKLCQHQVKGSDQSRNESEKGLALTKGQMMSAVFNSIWERHDGYDILLVGGSRLDRELHDKEKEERALPDIRFKTCSFVACPDIEELIVQLELVSNWLEAMVCLDASFGIDLECLETEDQLLKIEDVLLGKRATTELPQEPFSDIRL